MFRVDYSWGMVKAVARAEPTVKRKVAIQVTDDGLDWVIAVEVGKKWFITGYILKVESKGFADILGVECERKRGVMDIS